MRLDLQGLTLTYGDVTALREVSAAVEGRILGVLGANASGKTSLLKILAGIIAPTDGRACIDGEAVSPGRTPWISYLPQETGFFPFAQRATETLTLSLLFRGIVDPDAPRQLLAALGLDDENRSPAGYSGGMKQKLRIAQALVHAARLLLLDEPTTGLDTRERFRVLRLLERLHDRVAIIFSTHQPEDAAAVCDTLVILHRGRLAASGTPAEITAAARGRVFEVRLHTPGLPDDPECELVHAERDGDTFLARVVGKPPAGAVPVAPRLEDAYLLLTRGV
jgi:ABC-type multidrug transport system ATPase subunit